MQEFSVKEISQILSSILKNAFPEMVAVTGEISQVSKQNSSGHIYFTLKEGESTLNATYFKYYHASNNFMSKLGDKVKVYGDIKTYDKSSSYQINVKKIEYDSEGLLWKQFEEMKKKLFAEGLFDESRKRPIPKYPYRVAVLTALTGAVIKDFIVTLSISIPFKIDVIKSLGLNLSSSLLTNPKILASVYSSIILGIEVILTEFENSGILLIIAPLIFIPRELARFKIKRALFIASGDGVIINNNGTCKSFNKSKVVHPDVRGLIMPFEPSRIEQSYFSVIFLYSCTISSISMDSCSFSAAMSGSQSDLNKYVKYVSMYGSIVLI